ncbi:MAG: signal peptidase II [Paracoccaceae bacterium]|nr:signal peptidase II [Paracoccaceae bacterium]
MTRDIAAIRRKLLIAAGIVLVTDRVSKFWVVEVMDLASRMEIPVSPPWLTFVMAWNPGINFGLFSGYPETMRWLLVVLAVAISVALFWWVGRRAADPERPSPNAVAIGAGIVIGGALGNAWDRLQYGAVADFLNMSCCGIANPYAFNIADVAIFAGAALIAWKA